MSYFNLSRASSVKNDKVVLSPEEVNYYMVDTNQQVPSSQTSIINPDASKRIQVTGRSSGGTVPISGKGSQDSDENLETDFKLIKPENKQNLGNRFADYFSRLGVLELKQGSSEPLELKSFRPFLLANEAILSKPTLKMKGNSKGKSGKKGKSREIGKMFTAANPLPNLNKFIPSNKPYRFTQEYEVASAFTTSTTLPVFYATNFAINSLDQLSSLTSIFDQYKIDEIEVWLLPTGMGTSGAVGTSGNLWAVVVDYDDSNVLTTFAQALDYTNVITAPQSDGIYRRFKPHVAVATYSGTFTSFSNTESPWIDAASTGVQHYGIKAASLATSVASAFNMIVRLHTSWRNIR